MVAFQFRRTFFDRARYQDVARAQAGVQLHSCSLARVKRAPRPAAARLPDSARPADRACHRKFPHPCNQRHSFQSRLRHWAPDDPRSLPNCKLQPSLGGGDSSGKSIRLRHLTGGTVFQIQQNNLWFLRRDSPHYTCRNGSSTFSEETFCASRSSDFVTRSLEPSPTASARANTIPPKSMPKASLTMPGAIRRCSSAIATASTTTSHFTPTLKNRAYCRFRLTAPISTLRPRNRAMTLPTNKTRAAPSTLGM